MGWLCELKNILKEMDLEFFAGGKHKISPKELFESSDNIFLDVRSIEEVQTVAFPLKFQAEYIHIPTSEIPDRLSDIPRNKTIGVFCSAGIRAAIVYVFLRANGFENVKILVGGYQALLEEFKPAKIWGHIQ